MTHVQSYRSQLLACEHWVQYLSLTLPVIISSREQDINIAITAEPKYLEEVLCTVYNCAMQEVRERNSEGHINIQIHYNYYLSYRIRLLVEMCCVATVMCFHPMLTLFLKLLNPFTKTVLISSGSATITTAW